MKKLLLIALAVVAAAAPVRAQQKTPMSVKAELAAVLDRLEGDPTNLAALRRAAIIRTALGMSDQLASYRSPKGNGDCDADGNCYYDCSGYVASVLQPVVYLPRDTAHNMYRRADSNLAVKSVMPREAGDILFFKSNDDPSKAGHTAIYLGNDRFVHMYGKEGAPLRISSFDGNARAGTRVTWRQQMMASADPTALPVVGPDMFDRARKAAGGAKTVRVSPSEPGGVYISPEVIQQAMSKDRAGVLDALESVVLDLDFEENPVQGIDIEIPPDFDR